MLQEFLSYWPALVVVAAVLAVVLIARKKNETPSALVLELIGKLHQSTPAQHASSDAQTGPGTTIAPAPVSAIVQPIASAPAPVPVIQAAAPAVPAPINKDASTMDPLDPIQKKALFKFLATGDRSLLAIPGVADDQWSALINQYASGGTNYGEFLSWIGMEQNELALTRYNLVRSGNIASYVPGTMFYDPRVRIAMFSQPA